MKLSQSAAERSCSLRRGLSRIRLSAISSAASAVERLLQFAPPAVPLAYRRSVPGRGRRLAIQLEQAADRVADQPADAALGRALGQRMHERQQIGQPALRPAPARSPRRAARRRPAHRRSTSPAAGPAPGQNSSPPHEVAVERADAQAVQLPHRRRRAARGTRRASAAAPIASASFRRSVVIGRGLRQPKQHAVQNFAGRLAGERRRQNLVGPHAGGQAGR